jgi:hypothetical protein
MRFWLGLLIGMIQVVSIPSSAGSAPAASASKRVEGCHIEAFGVHNAFRDIAQRANVVIGVEAVQPDDETKIVLDFPGGTVADLLNMVVAQSPRLSMARRRGHHPRISEG